MSTQCLPNVRLLAKNVSTATLPELSANIGSTPRADEPLQAPELSAKTTMAPALLRGANPLPETWNEPAGVTTLGVTVRL